MSEELTDRVDDDGRPFYRVHGPRAHAGAVPEQYLTNGDLVTIGETLWEDWHAHGVEIFANATEYAHGAQPIVVVCHHGCGHRIPKD